MKNQNFPKTRLTLSACLFAIFLFTFSCSKSSGYNPTGNSGGDNTGGTGGPGTNEVFILSSGFSPSTLTVSGSTTITWTNKDVISHTVTSDNGLFDSGPIPANGTFAHTFTASGSFPYHCTIHPSMVAKVVITSTTPLPGY